MEDEFFKLFINLMNHIESNTDHREKKVGDYVRVWDGSANVDNLGRSRHGIDPLFKQKAILVMDDCEKKITKRQFLLNKNEIEEILDCELFFPESGITVWTKKQFLQLADFQPLLQEQI